MQIERVVNGIRNSPLEESVKDEAVEAIRRDSGLLTNTIERLYYSPPSAHENFYLEITDLAMSIITPVLRRASVREIDGTNTYAHIYASVTREDPREYLETEEN